MKAVGLAAVALAAGIPFVLGKYFELNFPDPYDSAIYAYSAQHILDGAKIGVEEIPSAQIGTLVVNMAGVALTGFNEIGPKLIQGLLQLGALVLMFVALRRLFGAPGCGSGCNRGECLPVCPCDRQVRQRQRAAHDRPHGHGHQLLHPVPTG